MYWDKLPPRRIEDCRYRSAAVPGQDDASASCGLVAQAGVPRDQCVVPRDACSACLGQFPPTPECWNPVVASLIYARSTRCLQGSTLSPAERSNLARSRARASDQLTVGEGLIPPEMTAQAGSGPANSLRTILPPPRPRWRHRVRVWAVGVVTSPRRQPTLDVTLDSLTRAGWEAPYLFLDGSVRVHPRFAHLPGALREPRVGCWPNYYLALAELLMRHP